ncbi:hypothetical protein [Nesterenkonia pannonica]|uniref:hypothetical protein n=1 Tax=Nesterenkonia pannonica TaxID=1548602 RepID=UPI002164BA5C|nr:hypothetical protein [Nesterenkonia pannonica]
MGSVNQHPDSVVLGDRSCRADPLDVRAFGMGLLCNQGTAESPTERGVVAHGLTVDSEVIRLRVRKKLRKTSCCVGLRGPFLRFRLPPDGPLSYRKVKVTTEIVFTTACARLAEPLGPRHARCCTTLRKSSEVTGAYAYPLSSTPA